MALEFLREEGEGEGEEMREVEGLRREADEADEGEVE